MRASEGMRAPLASSHQRNTCACRAGDSSRHARSESWRRPGPAPARRNPRAPLRPGSTRPRPCGAHAAPRCRASRASARPAPAPATRAAPRGCNGDRNWSGPAPRASRWPPRRRRRLAGCHRGPGPARAAGSPPRHGATAAPWRPCPPARCRATGAAARSRPDRPGDAPAAPAARRVRGPARPARGSAHRAPPPRCPAGAFGHGHARLVRRQAQQPGQRQRLFTPGIGGVLQAVMHMEQQVDALLPGDGGRMQRQHGRIGAAADGHGHARARGQSACRSASARAGNGNQPARPRAWRRARSACSWRNGARGPRPRRRRQGGADQARTSWKAP